MLVPRGLGESHSSTSSPSWQEERLNQQDKNMEVHERKMLNIGGVGAAAIGPIHKTINTAGDSKSEKTLATVKCGLTPMVSIGADGY